MAKKMENANYNGFSHNGGKRTNLLSGQIDLQ